MPEELADNLTSLANQLLVNLSNHAASVANKYSYYNATQDIQDIGISLPKRMSHLRVGVGWAARAVNTLTDRLSFDGFANDFLGVNERLATSGAFNAFDKSKNDAVIAGCAFIAIGKDYQAIPFSAQDATGEIDERTGLLRYGLAVTRWMNNLPNGIESAWSKVGMIPQDYILFTSEYTAYYVNKELVSIVPNPTGRPLLHAITHRQSADRPLGKARISNTVRRIVDEVCRLKIRYEVAAEFYSTPQRYINGLANGATKDENMDSVIGKVWAITKDEDGEKPDIGQLAQMSINQFSEQKKDLARDFCAETALTLRNLGYETANPTSADSLEAMSDDLKLEAKECQDELGRQFKNIAISMVMYQHDLSEAPAQADGLRPSWKALFQPEIGAAGDALYKLFEIMPALKGSNTAYRLLGLSREEAEEMVQRENNMRPTGFMESGKEEEQA